MQTFDDIVSGLAGLGESDFGKVAEFISKKSQANKGNIVRPLNKATINKAAREAIIKANGGMEIKFQAAFFEYNTAQSQGFQLYLPDVELDSAYEYLTGYQLQLIQYNNTNGSPQLNQLRIGIETDNAVLINTVPIDFHRVDINVPPRDRFHQLLTLAPGLRIKLKLESSEPFIAGDILQFNMVYRLARIATV